MDYKRDLRAFLGGVANNVQLIKNALSIQKKPAKPQFIGKGWGECLREFYQEMDGFELDWSPFKFQEQAYVSGKVRILSAEQVAGDWQGTVYFSSTENQRLRHFRIVDFFVSEAAIGFYDIPSESEKLYLYHFAGDPIPLNVDFGGYLQLLLMARGYFYWQKTLLAIESGKSNQEYEDFKTYMPQIFPDFDYKTFEELYHSVKLRK